MKTIPILSICLLLSAMAACTPSSAPNEEPRATAPLSLITQPTATHTPRLMPTTLLVETAEPTATRTSRPTSTPIVVEGVGGIVSTIQLPNLGGLFPAIGAGAVWVPGQGRLTRIDPATMEIVATITLDEGKPVPPGPYAVTVEGTRIWATELANRALVRIDPETNQIVDRIELNINGELHAIALDGTTIWVAVRGLNKLLHVDTATRKIITEVSVDDPTSIAVGYGSVWVVEHHKGNLVRIDPNTGSVVARIQLGNGTGSPGQVAIGEGGVWVGQIYGQMVSRVDPRTNQEVSQIELGLLVLSVKTSPGAVWAVVGPFEGCGGSGVIRIDPDTNAAVGKIPIRCAGDIAVDPDDLWVTSFQYREITLITPAQ